jgi:hypothetical protein
MDVRTNAALTAWLDGAAHSLPSGWTLIERASDYASYSGAAVGRHDPHASEQAGSDRFNEIMVVNGGHSVQRDARREIDADALPQLEAAGRFWRRVNDRYGEPSGIRVDATGHGFGGTCAYAQRASAIESGLPQDAWPEIVAFATLGDGGLIQARWPQATPDRFTQAMNYVRVDDRIAGPYASPGSMPSLGQNVLLPRDRDADGPLGAHAVSSTLRWTEREMPVEDARLWSNLRVSLQPTERGLER